MAIEIDNEIQIVCDKCGNLIETMEVEETMEVYPCASCLDDAYKDGQSDGYLAGYDEGREDGEESNE